jgi:hypothetical protein
MKNCRKLTIKVEGFAGGEVKDEISDMLDLAIQINCNIEMEANGRTISVYPDDRLTDLIISWENSKDGDFVCG